jgi:hypothetical protein
MSGWLGWKPDIDMMIASAVAGVGGGDDDDDDHNLSFASALLV